MKAKLRDTNSDELVSPLLNSWKSVKFVSLLTVLLLVRICVADPAISLKVQGDDAYVTIVSDVPWILYQSGDLIHWTEIYRSKPVKPGAVQIFLGVDKGWVRIAKRSFYRVAPADGKPKTPTK